jgi:hypothetical protein
MDSFEDFLDSNLVEIPPEFRSSVDGEPFKECLVCGCDLLSGQTEYMIEKAMKRYKDYTFESTVFEYAICMNCAGEMREQMSKESIKNMEAYFMQNSDFGERAEAVNAGEKADWKSYISHCTIKGTPAEEEQEYQLCAKCVGGKMVVAGLPFLIGEAAMDEIAELLSDQTLGEMDDFMGKYGVPPELRELLSDRPVLVF